MPATPLTPALRYLPVGQRKYNWLTAVANTSAPTRAEINAGIDLTGEIAAVNGFEILTPALDVTAFGDLFSVTVPGLPSVTDPCELIFYASSNSTDVRTLLRAGTAGFLLVLPEGDVSGQKCEVWPMTVRSMFIDQAGIDAPAQIHVQFALTSAIAQNVTVP
jgi:hypothetical protein